MSARDFLHSGRRGFLRGIGGAVVSLPLLEMTHGRVRADAASPKRFVVFYEHGGTITNQRAGGKHDGRGEHHGVDLWKPADPGERLVLGPIHGPLVPYTDKLMVLQGVDNRAAISQDRYSQGGHGISNVTSLTASAIDWVGPSDDQEAIATGPSIDQVVAERLAARQTVPFERVHLKVPGHDYGSPFSRASHQRVGGQSNPAEAFATLFDGIGTTPDPAAVRRRAMRRSVLDGVLSELGAFRGVASARDMRAIDAHLEHLRALEREIAALGVAVCEPPSFDADGDRLPGDVVGPLHVQIAVAALRCGLTNVVCLEVSDVLTPWTEAGLQVESAFGIGHSLHHMAREIGPTGPNASQYDAWMTEALANRQWRMELLAELVRSLDDTTFAEGGGTMLDNSLVLATSEFSNGSGHVAWNQPVLLAGSAGGHFRTGRHVNYDTSPDEFAYSSGAATHNLFTSVLQAMGETDEHFGSDDPDHQGAATGPLPGLT